MLRLAAARTAEHAADGAMQASKLLTDQFFAGSVVVRHVERRDARGLEGGEVAHRRLAASAVAVAVAAVRAAQLPAALHDLGRGSVTKRVTERG